MATPIEAARLRATRRARVDRLGRTAPERPERPHHRIERGHAALLVRPRARRGARRLDVRPQRSDPPRLHHARGLRGADVAHRRHARHHRRLLRRQEQLVGLLRLLGVPAVRPHQRQGHGRRSAEVGEGKETDVPRCARRIRGRPTTRRNATIARIRAYRDEVLAAPEEARASSSTSAAPRNTPARRLHMPDYPNEGARPRRPHPRREERARGPGRSIPTTERSRRRRS